GPAALEGEHHTPRGVHDAQLERAPVLEELPRERAPQAFARFGGVEHLVALGEPNRVAVLRLEIGEDLEQLFLLHDDEARNVGEGRKVRHSYQGTITQSPSRECPLRHWLPPFGRLGRAAAPERDGGPAWERPSYSTWGTVTRPVPHAAVADGGDVAFCSFLGFVRTPEVSSCAHGVVLSPRLPSDRKSVV